MRGRPVRWNDFSRGLNLRDDPFDLAADESADEVNVRPVGEKGAIVQREGDSAVVGLGFSYGTSGRAFNASDDLLMIGSGRTMAAVDPSGATVTMLENFVGSFQGVYSFVYAPAMGGQGPIYYQRPGNPFPVPRYFNGSTAGNWTAASGTLPAARAMVYAGNRVWIAGHNSDTVYWSELGDPRTWPAANVNRFGVDDGDSLTGIAAFDGNVLVFKALSMWRVYDLDTGANDQVGGIGGTPLVTTPHGVVVMTNDRGLCITTGGELRPIGERVPVVDQLYGATYADESLYVAGHPGFDPAASAIYEYRFPTQTWWKHTGSHPYLGLVSQEVAGGSLIYGVTAAFGSPSPASRLDRLFDPDQATDADDVALAPRWVVPYQDFGDSRAIKRIRGLQVAGKGTFTVTGRQDFDDTTEFTRGPYTLPASGVVGRQVIPDLGVVSALQMAIEGSGTTDADRLQLDEITAYITPRRG